MRPTRGTARTGSGRDGTSAIVRHVSGSFGQRAAAVRFSCLSYCQAHAKRKRDEPSKEAAARSGSSIYCTRREKRQSRPTERPATTSTAPIPSPPVRSSAGGRHDPPTRRTSLRLPLLALPVLGRVGRLGGVESPLTPRAGRPAARAPPATLASSRLRRDDAAALSLCSADLAPLCAGSAERRPPAL